MRNFFQLSILLILMTAVLATNEECDLETLKCGQNLKKYAAHMTETLNPDGESDFTQNTMNSKNLSATLNNSYCHFIGQKPSITFICNSENLVNLDGFFIPYNLKTLKFLGVGIRSMPPIFLLGHMVNSIEFKRNKELENIAKHSFHGIKGLSSLYFEKNPRIKWSNGSFFYVFEEANELRSLVLESSNIKLIDNHGKKRIHFVVMHF